MQSVEEVILENGTVWFISTSSWTGKDKLKAEDIGVTQEDVLDIIELGSKKLLPKEIRVRLSKPRSQVTSLMDRIGKHFLHFKGAWWVPDSRFLVAKEGIDKIIETQQGIVDDLIMNLPDIKQEMISEYPILESADWPSNDKIRRRFGINCAVCEVHGVSMKPTDTEELASAKRAFKEELTMEYEQYKENILKEAQLAIIDACHEINQKITEGNKITEGSLKKPKRVIDDYLNIAEIFDIEDVRTEVAKIKSKFEDIQAEELRGDFSFATDFAESLKNMASNIGDLTGLSKDGQAKRVVKKAA